MKNIFNLIVIICGIIGLYFSAIGLWRFSQEDFLFIIAIFGCIISILLGAIDIVRNKKSLNFEKISIFLIILGGIILILACMYILFFGTVSIFIKFFSLFGIIFFSIGIAKGITKLFKNDF